jgi:hypothetical protein
MTDQTELRVIELSEAVGLDDGMTVHSYEYTIQYRNDQGPWISLPVTRTTARGAYQRMKDGADD